MPTTKAPRSPRMPALHPNEERPENCYCSSLPSGSGLLVSNLAASFATFCYFCKAGIGSLTYSADFSLLLLQSHGLELASRPNQFTTRVCLTKAPNATTRRCVQQPPPTRHTQVR